MNLLKEHFHIALRLLLPCAILVISIFFESRALALGSFTAIMVVFLAYRNISPSKSQIIWIITGMLTILLVLVMIIKSDSSQGRLLIYKITIHIYRDHWLWGIGYGNFQRTYMHYQGAYFLKGDYSIKELMLADNTYFAFNDYFQYVVETGLGGLILLLTIIIGFILLIKKALKNSSDVLLYYALSILVIICIAANFTYIFNNTSFQIVAIISSSIILFYGTLHLRQRNIRISTTVAISLSLILMLPHYILQAVEYNEIKKLKQAKLLERAGYKKEALDIIKNLKMSLSENTEYLEFESYNLLNTLQLSRAKTITEKLIRIKPSNELYSRLGSIAVLQKDFSEAEKAYLYAINMVPNRLTPRYKLYQCYKSSGEEIKARTCGRAILTLPIKVPSSFATQIKLTVAEDFNKLNYKTL